mgnify:FL=1|tara:strand:- start:6982 stop:7362 length:381 start_codon:yes stop_codon:yes gene_type:complete
MADHQATAAYSKTDATFATTDAALQDFLDSNGTNWDPDLTTVAEYNTWRDGKNWTETRHLTSGRKAVATGTIGNGFALVRTHTEANLKSAINADSSLAPVLSGGWSDVHEDIDPATGREYQDRWWV